MSDEQQSGDESSPSWWRRLRSRRATRWAMDLAIVAVVILAISAFQSRHLLDESDPLPPFELQELEGSTTSTDEFDADRTIIYFWSTWCSVCDVQNGVISWMHDRAEDDEDLDVISIARGYQNRGQVEDYVDENDIDFPVYLGTDAVGHAFEIESYPTIYIVDDDARIRHGLVGYTTRFGLWGRLLI